MNLVAGRRIWSETVPHAQVCEGAVLGLLRRFGVELVLAVRPWDLPGLGDVAHACADAGVTLTLWPMLADVDGRWMNVHTAHKSVAFVRAIVAALGARGLPPAGVAFDLEPSIDDVRALLRVEAGAALGALRRSSAGAFDRGEAVFVAIARELESRGVRASAAVVPLVLLDPVAGNAPWQALLGTPADAPRWSHVSVMLYTSIVEGWSRGALSRAHAAELLAATCRATIARYGSRGGVSLGAVGRGAFGDEPLYRAPRELAEDVAIARSHGIEAITLLDLGGVLARPPAEDWLRALAETEPRAPRETGSRRLRVARSAGELGTRALLRLLRDQERDS